MRRVMIFNHGGKNMVWPPCLLVHPGEQVTFKVANSGTRIYFPEREIFKETSTNDLSASSRGTTLYLTPDGATLTVAAQDKLDDLAAKLSGSVTGASLGVYPYSVYCACGNDFAEGHSTPVMIIEPPDPSSTQSIQVMTEGYSEIAMRPVDSGTVLAPTSVRRRRTVKANVKAKSRRARRA